VTFAGHLEGGRSLAATRALTGSSLGSYSSRRSPAFSLPPAIVIYCDTASRQHSKRMGRWAQYMDGEAKGRGSGLWENTTFRLVLAGGTLARRPRSPWFRADLSELDVKICQILLALYGRF